jgi:PAS domain S-box-containing protein
VEKLSPDLRDLGEGLRYLGDSVLETRKFANALAKGDLDGEPLSRNNEIAAPLKSLQASLQHLTWQTQQVATGDYQQRVAFMGNFSVAFNTMVQQLEERRLKDAEAKSKLQQYVNLLLENFPDIVLLFDIDGKIVSTSRSYLTCSKTEDPDIILNKTFDEFFSPIVDDDFLHRVNEFFRIAVADRRISETDKEIAFGMDGNMRHYAVRVTPMLNENGIVVGTMLVFHDLTEIRRTEIAEASNKAKSKFFSMLSHEIRTPINAILGITNIKMQNETLAPDIAEAFYMIHNSGNVLLNLINEVLDLSKIEAGKFQLVPVEYEAAVFINDTVQLNMTLVKNKPIEFKLRVDGNIPAALFGDPVRIRQILSNLLSNAFKYTAEGVVELAIYTEPGNAETGNENAAPEVMFVLRVSDTGQGMTDEQVHALFDEYSRFNPQANREVEGTGLGMSITQHLIQLMNGKISVESEPGKGSVFTVKLPQGRPGSGVMGDELAENLQQFRWSSVSRMKKAKIVYEPMPYGNILFVDDVESNLFVAKGLTEPYQILVDTATSGFEVVEKIKQGNVYDIIFMDHMMPKMDGIETTKIIREMNYPHPVVALTANMITGQTEMFLANGFNDCLSKPIDISRLDILLNKLVRDKQPSEAIEAAKVAAARAAAANAEAANAAAANVATDSKKSAVKMPQILTNPRLLKVFIRDVEKAALKLDELYGRKFNDGDDMQMYIITVHGMKSALASAGETELSAFAKKLEKAGGEKDTASILSETPSFIEGLRVLIRKITPEEEEEALEEDRAYLFKKLAVIKMACEAYKKRPAKDALIELRQKKWKRPTHDLLNTISSYLLHGEFEKAAEVARDNIRKA